MRAVWYERHGAPHEVIETGEMPTPTAGDGEVRIKLATSSVNPADCYRRRGQGGPMDGPRTVPNSDGAGVIDQVGSGIPEGWLGRRVWLYNGQRGGRAFGTAAEYIALSFDLVSALPENTGFDAGACLGIPCMTAHRAVFTDGSVEGKTVLVTGGAGAVGHYAIQLAVWGGAKAIATVSSPEKAAHAKAGGAALVLNYRTENVAEAVREFTRGAGVDRIVDVDFGGNLATSLTVLKANSAIAVYASNGNRTPTLPVRELMQKNVSVHGIVLNNCPIAARRQAQADIARWLATGRAQHTIAARFPLARTADAHAFVESGAKLGTVLVTI
jgi:NADPH2:quinone reductase